MSLGFALGFVGPAQPVVHACNIQCVLGDNGCDPDAHYAYVTEITGSGAGAPHWECIHISCFEGHAPCAAGSPVPAEDLDVLEHAAIAADRARVQSVPSSLTVNIERSALQQLDCGGNVVVHIPVPSTLIGDLAEGRH